jgi:hypothetical protein
MLILAAECALPVARAIMKKGQPAPGRPSSESKKPASYYLLRFNGTVTVTVRLSECPVLSVQFMVIV